MATRSAADGTDEGIVIAVGGFALEEPAHAIAAVRRVWAAQALRIPAEG